MEGPASTSKTEAGIFILSRLQTRTHEPRLLLLEYDKSYDVEPEREASRWSFICLEAKRDVISSAASCGVVTSARLLALHLQSARL